MMRATFIFCFLTCVSGWAQAPGDSQPAGSNVMGAEYPRIYSDNRVTFQLRAPDAQKVQVQVPGARYDMTKGENGVWSVTTPPMVPGFHYYSLAVDGVAVNDPGSRTFYGTGKDSSGIEIPEIGVDYYSCKDVPRGDVRMRSYFSKTTGKWRRCFVYTPPDYYAGKARYPVLYLPHGWGENDQGWHTQGHADLILDNLIAAKKAKPMIIAMDNLNAVRPGEDGSIFNARWLSPPRQAPPAAEGAKPAATPARASGLAGFTGSAFTEIRDRNRGRNR